MRDTDGRYYCGSSRHCVVGAVAAQHRQVHRHFRMQTNGAPVSSLLDEIENARTAVNTAGSRCIRVGWSLPVIKHAGADLSAATGIVFDRLACLNRSCTTDQAPAASGFG